MSNITWDGFGVSVKGPQHSRVGVDNQDCYMVRNFSWGNVVVVSDGLGSRISSANGSRAACESVIDAAIAYQDGNLAEPMDIHGLIHEKWLCNILPLSAHECAATCLFAIRFENDIILGRLGDGLIAICRDDSEEYKVMNDSKEDSFSNLTHCLSEEFQEDMWEVAKESVNEWDAVVLCTDGISEDLLPEKTSDFAKQFYLCYRECSSEKRSSDIENWLNKWPVLGHSDDKTIACMFKTRGVE